jgi:hypothetical protein
VGEGEGRADCGEDQVEKGLEIRDWSSEIKGRSHRVATAVELWILATWNDTSVTGRELSRRARSTLKHREDLLSEFSRIIAAVGVFLVISRVLEL